MEPEGSTRKRDIYKLQYGLKREFGVTTQEDQHGNVVFVGYGMSLKTEVEFGIKRIGNVNFLKIKVQCGLKVPKQTKMIEF